ncbi:MAG: hypothetical protein ACP6IT_09535 [Candidatus Thorarchaeota archaeon]
MSSREEKMKSVIDEEERKRLISEIARIKDVLDSFKYGLNFEEFADEIFKTIDRQTRVIRQLDERMREVIERMESLEAQLKEGIRVRVSGLATSAEAGETGEVEFVVEEEKEEESESEIRDMSREELEREAAELEVKIAKLFEKENEYTEMELNDPAGAEEYAQKAAAARRMRAEAEARLKEIREQLE